MECHSRISFIKTPKIWFNDKMMQGINNPSIYIFGLVPSIFVIISLIASLITIINLSATALSYLTLIFLFIYGLINLVLLLFLQRNIIRLNKTRSLFDLVHKHIITRLRDYISARNGNQVINSELKIKYIEDILTSFNDYIFKKLHRKDIVITLKYLKENKLHNIRIGDNIENRDNNPESIDKSYIYKALTRADKRLKYIYVKDLSKPDLHELQAIGQDLVFIKGRAVDKYKTFIAVPIRSNSISSISTKEVQVKKDLGLLGFDLKEEYGFGNLDFYELNIIFCLSDSLSIIVEHLIKE